MQGVKHAHLQGRIYYLLISLCILVLVTKDQAECWQSESHRSGLRMSSLARHLLMSFTGVITVTTFADVIYRCHRCHNIYSLESVTESPNREEMSREVAGEMCGKSGHCIKVYNTTKWATPKRNVLSTVRYDLQRLFKRVRYFLRFYLSAS